MILYGLLAALFALMWIRNEWVYEARVKMINAGMDEYRRLPSYTRMMVIFWVWDVRRFQSV